MTITTTNILKNNTHTFQKSSLSSLSSYLDFLLSHLSSPIFPRNISTYESKGSQFMIDTIDGILTAFLDSKFKDCRVNAFPLLRDGKSWIPDLIFIDLDLSDFKNSRKVLAIALAKTLRNIVKYLGEDAKPTVLWSGNGYHVIQPVECPGNDYQIRQHFKDFNQFCVHGNPAEEFLRFAKILLSDNKADKNNNPSFRSCLLRIPGTINSKNGSRVKIIQKWNGYRPTITKELFIMFHEYLIQKKIDYNLKQEKIWKERRQQREKRTNEQNINNYGNYYQWIEKLLQSGIEDCRKLIIDLILAPYLICVKGLEYGESYKIIRHWLDKCNLVRKLDFNPKYLVRYALNTAIQKRIPPMKLGTLKNRNLELYHTLQEP